MVMSALHSVHLGKLGTKTLQLQIYVRELLGILQIEATVMGICMARTIRGLCN